MRLHGSKQSFKVNAPVPTLQQWIVNYEAGVRFGDIPTGIAESPFRIKSDGNSAQKMISNVKVLRVQLCVDVDYLVRGRNKEWKTVIHALEEKGSIARGDNRDGVSRDIRNGVRIGVSNGNINA